MAKEWLVFDNWEGGGFFADGSFDAAGRFHSINMQRYQNGSIGPRPGWRRLTQSADGSSSIPSVAAANKSVLQQAIGFAPYGPANWSYGVVLFMGDEPLNSGVTRRIRVKSDGTAVYHAGDATALGAENGAPANGLRHVSEPYQVNAVQVLFDGSLTGFIGGMNTYTPLSDAAGAITPRSVDSADFYPSKLAYYQGRVYGWMPRKSHGSPDAIVYSGQNTPDAFDSANGGGDFRIFADSSFSGTPRGLWALPSGLLIFSAEGLVRQNTRYSGVTTPYSDHGRWDLLTGRDVQVGSVRQLAYDTGPLYHSLSVVYDGKLMFPIYDRGWAIHDGQNALDKVSLASLKPGRGAYVSNLWYAPVKTDLKPALILPFEVDSTITPDQTGLDDEDINRGMGQFSVGGYGAFEFVNGAWTEQWYMSGLGELVGYSKLEEDKLVAVHLTSSDLGANYSPQIYVRDVTLDRPATVSSQNTYNPFSSGEEGIDAETDMLCRLETGERMAPNGYQYEISQIVVDYDYWNSSLFDQDCGFEVEVIYRGIRDTDTHLQRVNQGRVAPPSTSVSYFPKRARAILNLPQRIGAASFQVRIRDLKGCAIHSMAAAVEQYKAY